VQHWQQIVALRALSYLHDVIIKSVNNMFDTVVDDLGREAVRTISNCGVSFDVISTMKFATKNGCCRNVAKSFEFFV
jgi:hypothetical protein